MFAAVSSQRSVKNPNLDNFAGGHKDRQSPLHFGRIE